MADDRDRDLYDLAVICHDTARSPAEREYYRGRMTGAGRRLAGGIGKDELEVVAVDLLADAADGLSQLYAAGYRDGLNGEPFKRGGA